MVVAASKKGKKTSETTNTRLKLVMKSGKVVLGWKSTVKGLRNGKVKMILVATNTQPLKKSEINYLAMLAKTQVHHYSGDNIALGQACGQFFNVSVMGILDGGDSDILTATSEN